MKKKLAILLLVVMTMSLVACGSQEDTNNNASTGASVEESSQPSTEVSGEASTEAEKEPEAEASTEAGTESEGTVAEGAIGVLDTVWPSFATAMKDVLGADAESYFGYTSYEATSAEELDGLLGFPVDHFDKVGDVAYMMHMMNANTFTGGVYQLTDAESMQAVADALKDNILNRQWMCGFPEKLIVVSFDDYVVAAFGNGQAVDAFATSLTTAYENATLLYEESI